jgi:hypothetical protein
MKHVFNKYQLLTKQDAYDRKIPVRGGLSLGDFFWDSDWVVVEIEGGMISKELARQTSEGQKREIQALVNELNRLDKQGTT